MRMSAPQRRRADTPKTSRRRRADRKRQLLQHAKQLFVSLGYQNTTTEKIAKAAGVSEPVLYRHFDSKKALFLEVLQEVRDSTLTRWYADTARLTDPLAKLHAISDIYLGSTREHALEWDVMHRSLVEFHDEEIAAFLRQFYIDCETLLARVIREGQEGGVFRTSLDARVGAWQMIHTALGYTLTRPLGIPLYQDANYLPQAIECMLSCLLNPGREQR